MGKLELTNIDKSYPANNHKMIQVLSNVSLSLEENEFITIMGESGVGKSTLVRIASGIEKPSKGKVLLEGKDTQKWKFGDWKKHRTEVQAVFQDAAGSMNPGQSIYANVEKSLICLTALDKRARKERILTVMELLGLKEDLLKVPVRVLSGGEQRRFALLRALVILPRYLILDEVLSGLDLVSKSQVAAFLKNYRTQYSCGVLMITHSLPDAYALSDRICLMEYGRITQEARKRG